MEIKKARIVFQHKYFLFSFHSLLSKNLSTELTNISPITQN